jgi:hypothetical protein
MIVVDASAIVEFLLQARPGPRVEHRLSPVPAERFPRRLGHVLPPSTPSMDRSMNLAALKTRR